MKNDYTLIGTTDVPQENMDNAPALRSRKKRICCGR